MSLHTLRLIFRGGDNYPDTEGWRASMPLKCSLTGCIRWRKNDGFRPHIWISAPKKWLLDEKRSKTGIFPHYPTITLTIWENPLFELMVRKLKKGRLSFLTIKWSDIPKVTI
ncbi:hypothetical protein LC20_09345 (plasmid) [Yersinia hibernica]|uniref:Uncharacterized protein n=1 Tax=Yersinia enterocolitica LC20 TaxID=1443113 RepID=A0A7U5PH34_YEREN|nr:hypothetical protein LC20_09345 [Yersinia hibernica]